MQPEGRTTLPKMIERRNRGKERYDVVGKGSKSKAVSKQGLWRLSAWYKWLLITFMMMKTLLSVTGNY